MKEYKSIEAVNAEMQTPQDLKHWNQMRTALPDPNRSAESILPK
jgi:hypothetical protein